MSDDEWPDRDRLADQIMADSRARAQAPVSFFREILRHYWMDNTPEEAMRMWRATLRGAPWYAADILDCFYTILREPPDDLVDLMQQNGWVMLYDETDTGLVPKSQDEYLDWLRAVHEEWSEVYRETVGE